MERTNTGLASTAAIIVVLLTLLVVLSSCASKPVDPYARNRNGEELRAVPMVKRGVGTLQPSSDAIVANFKSLRRPIIQGYKTYRPTTRECMHGQLDYTHIILTDEACAFIRRYTWEEMVVALAPLLKDAYWSGDVVATLATASNPFRAGQILSVGGYRSPEEQGSWSKYREKNLRDWSVGRGQRWGILHGELYDFSKYDIEHPLPKRPGASRD